MPALTGNPSALGRWQLSEAAVISDDGVLFVHIGKDDFPMRFKLVLKRSTSVIWHQGQDIQIQSAPFRRAMDISFFLGEVTDVEKRPILNGDYSWGPNYDWALKNKDPVNVLVEVSTVKEAMALCRWRYHMLNCLRVPIERFRGMCAADGILVPEDGRLLPRSSRLIPVVRNLGMGSSGGLDPITEESRSRTGSADGPEGEADKSTNPVIRIFTAAAETIMRPLTPKLEGRSGSRPTTPNASPRAGSQPPPIADLPPMAVTQPDARRQLDFGGDRDASASSPSRAGAAPPSPNLSGKSAFSSHRSQSAAPSLGGGSPRGALDSPSDRPRPTTPTAIRTASAARVEAAGGGLLGWVSSLASGRGSAGSVERLESERKLDPYVLDCDRGTAEKVTELRNKRDPVVLALLHEVETLKECALELRSDAAGLRERLAKRDADVAALEGQLAALGGDPKAGQSWRAAGSAPMSPPRDLAEAERMVKEARASAAASAAAHRSLEARLQAAGEELGGLREGLTRARAEVKAKERHVGVLDALLEERAAELANVQREVERLKGDLSAVQGTSGEQAARVQERVKEAEKREKSAGERAKKAEKSLEEAIQKARRAEEERDYWKAEAGRVKAHAQHQIEAVERVARDRERQLQAKTAENTELAGHIWSLGDALGSSSTCHSRTPRVAACWDTVVGKRQSALPHSPPGSAVPAAPGTPSTPDGKPSPARS